MAENDTSHITGANDTSAKPPTARELRDKELAAGVTIRVIRVDWLAQRGIEHWHATAQTKRQLVMAQASSAELAVFRLANELVKWLEGVD